MELRVAYVDHKLRVTEQSVKISARGTRNCRCKLSTTSLPSAITTRDGDVSSSTGPACSIITPRNQCRMRHLNQAGAAQASLPFGQRVASRVPAKRRNACAFKLACQVPCPPYTDGTPTEFLPACRVLR